MLTIVDYVTISRTRTSGQDRDRTHRRSTTGCVLQGWIPKGNLERQGISVLIRLDVLIKCVDCSPSDSCTLPLTTLSVIVFMRE